MHPVPALAPHLQHDSAIASPPERRAEPRHAPSRTLPCLVHAPDGLALGIALVEDLSGAGVRLLLDRPLRPGDWINVEFVAPATQLRRRLPMRVIHADAAPGGGHLVGGAFLSRLADEEFRGLLG